ncbi:MAG: DUF937 domain-containing protein, partial [Myxococcales bacterium]|nr:DUF937 domain-containing protein [Myxococcales bacterium]
MGVNLIDVFRDGIGDQTPVKISSYLGESTENTRSAIGTALPALLGGLLEKAQNLEGAAGLLDYIHHEQFDGSILDKQNILLEGGQDTTSLIEKGAGILDFILQDKKTLDNMIDIVTNRSGIGRGSADTLIKIISPFLMGIIGHQVKSKSLDSQGLSQLLLDQKKTLESTAPTGLFDSLGYTVFNAQPVPATKEKKESEKKEEEEEEEEHAEYHQSVSSRIIPWVILIAIAGGLLYIMKSCGGRPVSDSIGQNMKQDVKTVVEVATDDQSGDTVALIKPKSKGSQGIATERKVVDSIAIISLSQGAEIKVREGSFIDKFYQFVSHGGDNPYTRYTFDSLSFYDSTANITLASARQLEQVANILKSYPKVSIQLEGYAELSKDVGANKQLATQRAEAVKAGLVGMGIQQD